MASAFGKPSVRLPTDFNNDGKPDYLLYNPSTRQTAMWYLNNNVHIGGASGPDCLGRLERSGCGGF